MSGYTQAIITEAAVVTIIMLIVGGGIACLVVRAVRNSLDDLRDNTAARLKKAVAEQTTALTERADARHETTRRALEVPAAPAYTGESQLAPYRSAAAGAAGTRSGPNGTGPLATPNTVPPPPGRAPAVHRGWVDQPAHPPLAGTDPVDRDPHRRPRHGRP